MSKLLENLIPIDLNKEERPKDIEALQLRVASPEKILSWSCLLYTSPSPRDS